MRGGFSAYVGLFVLILCLDVVPYPFDSSLALNIASPNPQAVWMGTQADKAFSNAWDSDAVSSRHLRSKVYYSPRLWYLRVSVIEAQDLVEAEKNHIANVYVKAQLGDHVLKTKLVQPHNMNASWNEDLMFVAAEPFDDHLILSVENCVGPNMDEGLGKVFIPLTTVEQRADDRIVYSRWFSLQKPSTSDIEETKGEKFGCRVHVCICLEGGYHVFDEPTHCSSDLRPTAEQLWKPRIGILELGILNADVITPMKTVNGRGSSDTYCVAKYGGKWVRTRTVTNTLKPKYNEKYSWEVYDPATVLRVGVFDNNGRISERSSNGDKDTKIGKVRIRVSTLETGRAYTQFCPLLVLHPSGVKKMGDLHLAIRFSCTSMSDMMWLYSEPLLPNMHYKMPLTKAQVDTLRHQAVNLVAAELSRAEPPLGREVIEYMNDSYSPLWSMRHSKANILRLWSVFNMWWKYWKYGFIRQRTFYTIQIINLFILYARCPDMILFMLFFILIYTVLSNYGSRPNYPPHMNVRLSGVDTVHPDELDEEFDTFPSSRSPDIVRMRYDRLRIIASEIQTVVDDIVSQVERIEALLNWRDPHATVLFTIFCAVGLAVSLYLPPF